MLGAQTPPPALADAISRTGPAAVFIWSQTAATGKPAQLAGIPRQRLPRSRLLVAAGVAGRAGRAGPPTGRRRGPRRPPWRTLPEAIQQACEAVGAA